MVNSIDRLAAHAAMSYRILVLLLLTMLVPAAFAQGAGEIDVTSAAPLVEQKKLFVLDVREPSEYAAGHIADATLVPLGQLEKHLEELAPQKDQPVLVVCASGGRSAQAVRLLSKNGFTQAQNLKGGMNAWRKADLPIAKP
jgi:rhodanese-related sulfurtransferase